MSKTNRAIGEDGRRKMPAWLVSFTDMITLLLSFFILLQAFAHARDPDLFALGRGGFRRAISGLGIPDWLLGQRRKVDFGNASHKYPMKDDPLEKGILRVSDPEDERIRKLFEDLRQLQDVKTSDYAGQPARLFTTPITFARGEASLEASAKGFLRDFALNLRNTTNTSALSVYVIGLAPEENQSRARWMLAARRAMAARTFLETVLPEELKSRGAHVDSWGGGLTGPWSGPATPESGRAYIVLAVMDSQDTE